MKLLEKIASLLQRQQQKNIPTETLEKDLISKSLFFNYLDAQSAVILFFSPRQGWVGGNLAFYETFELENMEEFRRKYASISEFFNDENFVIFADDDAAWIEQLSQERANSPRVKMVLPNGRPAVYELRSSALKKGEDGLFFLEMSDVTLDEKSKKELEQVEASKRKFLNNISHEFRTPMNGILGFIELLHQSHPSAKQKEYLEMVDRSAKHMMSTIETLLDLAQMQSGRLKLAESEFCPIRELENLVEPFYYEAAQRGIHLNIFIDPKLPAYIVTDGKKLRQIISQLADNALKFTEPGGKITIEMRLLNVHEDKRFDIGVSVKDSGKGIDEMQLNRITRLFESGEHPDHRLGVGLSLTEGLLRMMDSELKIQSQKGIGSQFSFELNVGGANEPSFTEIKKCTAKVVLFDDELANDANVLSRYLRSFGIAVTKVHHTQQIDSSDVDLLYIVSSDDSLAWMMELTSISNRCRVVKVMQHDKPLPHRASHLVDYTLHKPLLPSRVAKHLDNIFNILEREKVASKLPKKSIKALIVEDNKINQRLIKLLLEQYNLSVSTADNGEAAIELCRRYPFDIIFMDIDMPIKDGIDATHEIKELSVFQSHPSPIIALTALAMQGDRERILAEGLDDYVSKPLGREKLEYILDKHLQKVSG